MFCPNCGATIPDSAQFCTSCGTRILPQAGGAAPTPLVAPVYGGPALRGGGSGGGTKPRKRRGLKIALIAIAAVALIGGGIFAATKLLPGGGLGGGGLGGGGPKTEPITVVKTRTQTVDSGYLQKTTMEYVYDQHGNVTSVNAVMTLSGVAVSEQRIDDAFTYSYTADGYLASITVAPEVMETDAPFTIPVASEVDASGRLTTLQLTIPGANVSVRADYDYYANTDALSSVTYTVNGGDGSAYIASLIVSLLDHAQLPCFTTGTSSIIDAASKGKTASFVANIDESGRVLNVQGVSDNSALFMNTYPSREERAGQTIELGSGTYKLTNTFDQNGYLTHSVQNTGSYAITLDYSYEQIEDPSRGAYIFGRIWS